MEEYSISTDSSSIDEVMWKNYISVNTGAHYSHSSEMLKIFLNTKKTETVDIFVKLNNKICGLAIGEIKRQIEYIPFTKRTIFYSMPLYDNIEVLEFLLENIVKTSKGLFIQIRPTDKLNAEEKNILLKLKFVFSDHLNAVIKISDLEEIWANFEKDKRKGIEKALIKYNLVFKEKTDTEGVNIFYDLQKTLYRKKRIILNNIGYFNNLIKYPHIFKIFIIYKNNIPICSQLVAIYNKRLTTLYTATDPEYKYMHAGDLMIWYLLKYCSENKIEIFDFGGGGNPNKEYGPRNYKKRFGTKFENVGRYNFYRSKISKNILNLYYNIKKK